AYLHINDATKLLIHSDPSVLDNTDNQKIHIKRNMDGTTIGTSTNFLMSTIACIESGTKQQTAPNVIPLEIGSSKKYKIRTGYPDAVRYEDDVASSGIIWNYSQVTRKTLTDIVHKLMLLMDKSERSYRDELLSKITEICSQNDDQHKTNFESFTFIFLIFINKKKHYLLK
ncbi:unnamed protein product, partial [Rotaria sordida]